MGTKLNPGKFDCAEEALPDEESFTLLARSPEFQAVVEFFADLRQARVNCGDAPADDIDLVNEARECAIQGARWRLENAYIWRGNFNHLEKQDPKFTRATKQPLASTCLDELLLRMRLCLVEELEQMRGISAETAALLLRSRAMPSLDYLLGLTRKRS